MAETTLVVDILLFARRYCARCDRAPTGLCTEIRITPYFPGLKFPPQNPERGRHSVPSFLVALCAPLVRSQSRREKASGKIRRENAPIGLILCSEQDAAVAHYALGNLGSQVLAREYQLTLPTEEQLARRIEAKRRQLDQ